MEPFEIKELLTVKGKPGLWKLVVFIPVQRMARIKNLVTDEACTVKIADVASIKDYTVYLTDGKSRTLEEIFGHIMGLEEQGLVTKEKLNSLDGGRKTFMELLVPNYDETQFKHYHLTKIIKWYNEIVKALDILNDGIVDPYFNAPPETEETEPAK